MSLSYDPLGRLYQTTAGSTVTRFLYSGEDLAAEYDGSNNVLRRYLHGPGTDDPTLWAEGSGWGSPHFLYKDTQGSVVAWSDASGSVTAAQVYADGGIIPSSYQNPCWYIRWYC